MTEYRSNLDHTYEHPNFVISLADELGLRADWLFGYLEGEVHKGVRFSDGQTVQVGWMLIKLVADDSGDLEIWEPKLDAIPIYWIRGGTNTFRHLVVQREVCSQIGVDPEFPSLTQSGVVSARFLTTRGDFTMSRDIPQASDSGWAFTRAYEIDLGGRHSSLFEVAIFDQKIIPFLALPPEVSVQVSERRIGISHESIEISSESNDFLRRLLD